MRTALLQAIEQTNPWLENKEIGILGTDPFIARTQAERLLLEDWDKLWLILIGPRQSGKTTLGRFICSRLLQQGRFQECLLLNCDLLEIREWLRTPVFVQEACETFHFKKPIFFIDEVQRLSNAGLLLKAIIDLKLPFKFIATGSSQLEIKSTVQEHLTGRHLECLILPLSYQELSNTTAVHDPLILGCYPQIVQAREKKILLAELYRNYIARDIIEILKMSKPDVMEKLLTLMAHASGQLVNYNQLSVDLRVSTPTVQHYLNILEKTYVIREIKPFVGNKRSEITSNPKCYFIDNGFRNQALRNFLSLEERTDSGLLVEGAVFQELYKFQTQHFKDFGIYFWRTKSGAEVDFVLYQNDQKLVPVEVKFRNMKVAHITRGFRSFVEAYCPPLGVVITRDWKSELQMNGCKILFIPLGQLQLLFEQLGKLF